MANKTTTPAVSEYEQQAIDFLTKHNATIDIVFTHKGINNNWVDESKATSKDVRNIYSFTIKRNGKQMSDTFYDSISNTEKGEKPTAYDILSCLVKHNPGSFEDFCGEVGYDEDSRKAEKIYSLCMRQYNKLKNLFTEDELEEMAEIQ